MTKIHFNHKLIVAYFKQQKEENKNVKTNKLLLAFGTFSIALLAALTFTKANAFAAARTWDGGGSDDNFSTAANWDADTTPVSGDSIILPLDMVFAGCTGNTPINLNNDLDSSTITFTGVTVNSSKPEGCVADATINGNTIKTSGNVIGTGWSAIFNTNIETAGNITIENIRASADLIIGTNNVTVEESYFDGVSGSGSLTLDSDGMGGGGGGDCSAQAQPNPFGGDGSGFSGPIIITGHAYIIVTSRDGDVARHASSITVDGGNSGVSFNTDNGNNLSYSKNITINGGYLSASQSYDEACNYPINITNVELTGNITINATTTVNLYKANLNFTGSLNGKENIALQTGQSGTISYPDGSTQKSEMKVVTIDSTDNCMDAWIGSSANAKLIMNIDCSESVGFSADFPFSIYGIFAGVGKIGHVKIENGGKIAPGLSPGTLTTGNIEWVEGSTYEFEIGKDGADKIVANGTVTLGNGTLSVLRYQDYAPKSGDVYTIIENDGSDAVSGTFKDLPEGATFTTADGAVYRINYVGGDGNDVILTVVGAPKVPNTGSELIKNNPMATFAVTTIAALIVGAIARKRAILSK